MELAPYSIRVSSKSARVLSDIA